MHLKIMIWVAAAISFFSCATEDRNNEKKDYSRILNSPQLSGITDSIKRFSDDPELRLRRAVLLSQMNQHEAATQDYKKAWDLTHDENVALEYASNLLLAQDVPAAVSVLEQGANQFPENPEFNRRLAEISVQKGDYREALKKYNQMLSIDSSNFEAWYDQGALLAMMKDTSGAINALERSFSLMPINYTGIALANLYVARKNPRAVEICDILLESDTANVQTEPLYMKGVYYADMKQYDNAIAQFDECIRRDWKMTDAYIEKGIILFERKQYDDALKVFNMTITVSNTDADGYYWLGRCYEAKGENDNAIVNYRRALSLDESFTEARNALQRLNS